MRQGPNGRAVPENMQGAASTGEMAMHTGRTTDAVTYLDGAGADNAAAVTSLTLLLLSISKATRALVGLKLGEIGLANGQDEMLLMLDEHTPQPVNLLAERLGIRPSTVSKTLERMVQRGLAHRATSRADSRVTLVTITPSGVVERGRLVAMRRHLEASLTDKMDRAELHRMADALHGVEHLLKQKLLRMR